MYTQFVALSNVELTRDDDDDYGGGRGRTQHYAYMSISRKSLEESNIKTVRERRE